MAESESGAEKSEEPTSRRIEKARADGMVGKSTDLSQLLGLTAAFLAIQYLSPYLWDDLVQVFHSCLSGKYTLNGEMNISTLHQNFAGLLLFLLPKLLLLVLFAGILGAGSMALQTKFLWSNKLLVPKFSNINPITGIKRLFGIQNFVNLLKSLAKLAIICPIGYFAFVDLFPEMLILTQTPISHLLPYTGYAASIIFWRIAPLMLVLAIADFAWQKYNNHKELKMTKDEVKDERKSIEGDEKTKMQIRQKAMQRLRQRMMDEVPSADVVVTNPTHVAVALKYDMTPGSAPRVVAKGRGYVADRIKSLAKENNVPVLERKALARSLFKAVEVGQIIPYELYAAVAELLAYVYKLRRHNPFSGKQNARR